MRQFSRILAYTLLCSLPARAVTLVENGVAKAAVVVAADAPAAEKSAADELVHYIFKATGARLPVASGAQGASIIVGLTACPPDVAARVRALKPDGIWIQADAQHLILAGSGENGTPFAVYAFLEKFAGVRWLWPGELGEVVPKTRSLEIQSTTVQLEPAFAQRKLGSLSESSPTGSSAQDAGQWAAYQHKLGIVFDPEALASAKLWAHRNGFGGPSIQGGHAFGAMVPPSQYGPTHPEYYALVNGKRLWHDYDGKHGAQLCTTNPDVIRLVSEYCIRTFEEHADYEMISISPNDGAGFCECDRCRRLDTGDEQNANIDPEAGGGRTRVITDRMMTFANQVTTAVVARFPNKKLSILAYGPYRQPPQRVRIHPSLNIQYHLRANMHWEPEAARREYEAAEGWSGAATNLGVTEFLIQGALADMPRLFPEPMAKSIRRVYALNYRNYSTQAGEGFATNGLNYYVLSKLLWDPSQDEDQIIADYIQKGFGPAAPAMRRYFYGLIDRWKDQRSRGLDLDDCAPKTYKSLAALYPPEFRKSLRADIEAALKAASGDDRRRVEFIAQALRYVDLTLDAVEKSIPLQEAGWQLGPKAVTAPSNPDWNAFGRSLAAWNVRDQFIAAQKNTLVLSYRWTRYNDYLRTFNPLGRMREWARSNRPTPAEHGREK
jgi:hypothetical protein